jgi:threonine/homoserine/homoserine lactone efflux protein
MDLTTAVLSFAALGALLTITPGLDTALVLRSAVSDGRRAAFATGLGISLGSLTWGAAAAVGVSALVTASEVGYTALRVGGAAYMVWLGGRLLWTAARGRAQDEPRGDPDEGPGSVWVAGGRGLLTNLLNPKVGAFYVAVLPQFIPVGVAPVWAGLLLASVHAVEGMLWFTAIILGARALRGWLRRRSARRAVDGVTGAVLVGFGLKLGLSAR